MSNILTAIFAIFTGVGEWIPTAVTAMIPMFWTAGESGAGQLTFLGVLGVAGLAFSVSFLMIGIIQKFLHFRG